MKILLYMKILYMKYKFLQFNICEMSKLSDIPLYDMYGTVYPFQEIYTSLRQQSKAAQRAINDEVCVEDIPDEISLSKNEKVFYS